MLPGAGAVVESLHDTDSRTAVIARYFTSPRPLLECVGSVHTHYGRQTGERCFPVVILVTAEPSAFMVNRPSLRANTSFSPSGDHAGSKPSVSRTTPLPSGDMSAMSVPPLKRVVSNAILLPSGLQDGSPDAFNPAAASCTSPVPSALITQIWLPFCP